MRVLFSILFSFFASIAVINAQNADMLTYQDGDFLSAKANLTVTGKVIDVASKTPLAYSSISLYSLKDSLFLAAGISDETGHFQIETYPADFFITIEFIAYLPRNVNNIDFTHISSRLDIGIIELMPNAELLEAVEVRAEKSSIMMSLDKRVFNVGKDLVSESGTAEDILRNVPGVWVDINGNVSLRSNGSVRVLLNGQTSLLISDTNSDGLRQIQANSIDRIEIITNPSAKYEAEGMAGIINIVLKKNENKGLNGALNTNVGNPMNLGAGINMNYRKNKINFFAGAGLWSVNRLGSASLRNRFYNTTYPDSTLFSSTDRTHKRHSMPLHIRVGTDYYFHPKNTLTASLAYRASMDKNTSNLIYKDAFGALNNVHLTTDRQEKERGEAANLSGFLRHRTFFSKKGHQLTTDIRYESDVEAKNSLYNEVYFDRQNIRIDDANFKQNIANKSGQKQLIIKSDYVLPIGSEAKFESGFQTSFRTIFDNYQATQTYNNVETQDTNFTNNFNYQEIINAVYINYGNKINNFSFQTGVRAEYSDIASGLAINDLPKTSPYLNFFPSASIGYDLGKDNGIQLSYSRRIERPTFLDLTPFFTLRDRRNIWRGNPTIRPEFTHAFELGYIKYWNCGTLSAVAYFRKTDDVIKRIQRIDERFPETTVTQAENLDIKKNYGIEFSYSFLPTKWWRLSGDLNGFHSFAAGTYFHNERNISVGGQSFSLTSKTINRFTLWKKLHTQFTCSYSAPRRTTQGINRATLALDFATSIDVLKNNATITLSVSDVFNTRRRRSFSEDETFYSEDNFLWQSRALVLSFHYRLNQRKKQSPIYSSSSPIKENNEERF